MKSDTHDIDVVACVSHFRIKCNGREQRNQQNSISLENKTKRNERLRTWFYLINGWQ